MAAINDDGTYEHISLMSGDNEIIAIAEDKLDLHGDQIVGGKYPVMSFNVSFSDSKDALHHAYNVLSKEARINGDTDGPAAPSWSDADEGIVGFSVVDKFGVHWGVISWPAGQQP